MEKSHPKNYEKYPILNKKRGGRMRVACGARLSEKPASLRFSKSADRPTRDERLPHTGCQGASGIGRLASALPDAAAAAAASGFVNTLLKRPLELDEGVHGHIV